MGDFRVPEGSFNMQIAQYADRGEVSAEEITSGTALDRQCFEWSNSLNEATLSITLAASLKIRKWLEKENPDAFTIAFPGSNRSGKWETVPSPECSQAMVRGIGYVGEGNELTAAATGVLSKVFPETPFTEMFCPDWKNDRIFTSHMGEINPRIRKILS